MGRLFWKFFLIFWLAQLVTVLGVGVSAWLLHTGHGSRPFPGPAMGAPMGPPTAAMNGPRQGPPPGPPGADRGAPPMPGPAYSPGPGPGPGPDHGGADWPLPVLPIVAGSIVSLLFAAWMALRVSRPIRALRRALGALSGGQLQTRVPQGRGQFADEIDDLGRDFNQMAARMQALVGSQRRLLHDVSHELRSPLARLQVTAGLLQQQPDRSPEFASRMLRDTQRMDDLIGELLTLARQEAGVTDVPLERFKLQDLLHELLESAAVEAQARPCRLDSVVLEDAPLQGRVQDVHRALENIVRNAIRHTAPGTLVRVALVRADGCWEIAVDDQGPGVFADDLARIFEPFYRGAPAVGKVGHGLGLAISQRIVESHGGTVLAHNRSEGGLRVVVRLPMSG